MNIKTAFPLLLAGMLSLPANAAAERDNGASLVDALTGGRLLLQLRPRYNYISEDLKPEHTHGWTLRSTLGWQSVPYRGLRLKAEAIHTDHLDKHFNDNVAHAATAPLPLLPDPRYSGLNRLHLDYDAFAATKVRVGKQLLRLDNQRFISDNDFRQIPTLFNGISIVNTSVPNTELFAAHLRRVRNAFGDEHRLRLNLLHAAHNPAPQHSVAAYAYFHDQAATGSFTGFADNSYRVIGVRAEGGVALKRDNRLRLQYLVEVARQDDYASGDKRIKAAYYRAGAALAWPRWSARMDYEIKGSNKSLYALQTPLTDLYAFNGWALQFVTTPPQGLRDTWITLRWQQARWEFYAEYHQFDSDENSIDFGSEADLSIAYLLRNSLVLRAQHAHYRPGDARPGRKEVNKFWFTLTYDY